jgi:uncharacterized repeat protein (TIGR03803 family)
MRRIGVICLILPVLAPAASFQVLHSFSGGDGAAPTGIIQAADGLFYGAGASGGDVVSCAPDGCGVLFRSDKAGHVTVLHEFHATDGIGLTGLIQGMDGNLYGTTVSGGQPSGGGAGTIFRMDTAGNFTVLYAFTGGFACCDAGARAAQPLQAGDGNLYGTTSAGGAFRDIQHQGGFGTVYQFNLVSRALTILHSFNPADGNGIYPNGPLVHAGDGFFYGTTREGGATAFKIDRRGNFALVAALPGTQPLAG